MQANGQLKERGQVVGGWEVRCRQKWAGLGLQEISWEGDWSVVREGGRPTKWEGDPGSGRETNQRQAVSGLWAFHLDAKFSVGKSERCYWLETAVNTETHDMQDLHCRRAIFVCLYTGRCVNDIEFKQMKPALLWACCKSYCLELWSSNLSIQRTTGVKLNPI